VSEQGAREFHEVIAQVETFDIVVLCLLLAGLVFGAIRGLVWQLAWLAALVGSIFVALRWGPALSPFIGSSSPWNTVLAMLVLFLGTSLVVWLLFQWLAAVIDRLRLRDFDRQLGALFGLLKSLLLCLVLTFFGVTLTESTREIVLRSTSGRILARTILVGQNSLPSEVRDALKRYLDEFAQKVEERLSPEDSEQPL